jgi:hypothetical protein
LTTQVGGGGKGSLKKFPVIGSEAITQGGGVGGRQGDDREEFGWVVSQHTPS